LKTAQVFTRFGQVFAKAGHVWLVM
jgi:hypothetical protein